jgi:Predicted transmembrane transcriptional regulator (anti-sigma factor)
MNPIDNETLQAYVDGELDAAARARVDAALAQDDVLARRVRQLQALNAQLQAAFDPVLDEPVPARLSALLRSPATPTAAPAMPEAGRGVHASRRRAPRRWLVPGAALAASVALLAAGLWWWPPGNELVRMRDGEPYAAGVLGRALDHALASEPDAHAPVAIGLSFRAADGHICRSFSVRTPPARAGLACHSAAGWALPVLVPAVPSVGGELRQAASELPPAVQAAIDARLRGHVFDARQERTARAAGWR